MNRASAPVPYRIQAEDRGWTSAFTIGAVTLENVPSHMCAKGRLKSACASAQSDLSFPCPHEETLHPKMRTVKILIRLGECAGWSESSLGAHVRRYVFWRSGLYPFWSVQSIIAYQFLNRNPHPGSPLLLEYEFNRCSLYPCVQIIITCFIDGLARSNWIWFQTTLDF